MVETQSSRLPAHSQYLVGERFGRLTVIRFSYKKPGKIFWLCRCDCGSEKSYYAGALRSGGTQSCGCYKAEKAAKGMGRTHGLSRSKEYMAYHYMLQRCYNPKHKSFADYGGRGITVCERWHESFENFLADMGKAPTRRHQIDRVDNARGYSPDNCRWATPTENGRNKRNNHLLTYNGETKTVAEWAQTSGLSYAALNGRVLSGWPIEKALTHPLRITKRRA